MRRAVEFPEPSRSPTIIMNAQTYRKTGAWLAGVLVAWSATPGRSSDIPWIALEDVSLNPTSFYVSVEVTNAWAKYHFALEAYEGAPAGATGGVARAIVSDWVKGNDSTLTLYDASAPLSPSGRTYNVAVAPEIGGFYVLGPNELFAPYPFFTAPEISSIAAMPTNSGQVLAITYGEGLYRHTVYVPTAATAGFIRIRGTNNVPTNAVVEHSLDPMTWSPK